MLYEITTQSTLRSPAGYDWVTSYRVTQGRKGV